MNDLVPNVTGFDTFCSPVLSQPDKPKSVLPASCIFVSTLLQPERPPICDVIERSCSVINISSYFVTCKYHRVAVLSVYRSPSTCCSSAITELRSVLLQLSTSAKYIMMAGDFNVDLLSTNNSVTLDYVNLLADFNLSQHIIKPSRVCNHSATLIDIIGSNSLQVSGVGQAIGLSDHNVQLTDFNIPIFKRAPRAMMVQSFNRCDWEGLKDVSDSVPWQVMDVYDDIDDKWDFLKPFFWMSLMLLLLSGRSSLRTQGGLLPGFLMLFQRKVSLKTGQNKSLIDLVIS